jgi:hypothetical protein
MKEEAIFFCYQEITISKTANQSFAFLLLGGSTSEKQISTKINKNK